MKKALVIPRYSYANAMSGVFKSSHDDLTTCQKLYTYDPESTVSIIGNVTDGRLVTAPFKLADRAHCETNPTYLQIIPYIILMSEDNEVFIYERGQKGNEERLHHLFSMGLGGHIEIDTPSEPYSQLVKDTDLKYDNEGNIVDAIDVDRTLFVLITETIKQELQEEVGLELRDFEFQRILDCMPAFFTLYSDGDQVGSVHLGITAIIRVNKDRLKDHEKDVIQKGQWVRVDKIRDYLEEQNGQFEQWSRVCLDVCENHIDFPLVDLMPIEDIPDDLRDGDFDFFDTMAAPQ